MHASFIHLRVHSEYSIRDGIVRIKPLIKAVVDGSMPAIALNDDNNLFALVKFYKAAQDLGVKPIISVDVMVASREANDPPCPLTLFARDEIGYRNLSQLISKSYVEGQDDHYIYLKREWVVSHSEGLLALSAGKDGEVGRALLGGKTEYATSLVREWMEVFPDAFYLELHRTGRDGEEDYNAAAVDLALALGCPVVATNQVRFLVQEDYEAHEARVCIHEGTTLNDTRRERRYSREQYLKTPEQMVELFADIPEAIANTIEIARRCNVNLDLGNNYMPAYPVPAGYTAESYLVEVTKSGLEDRLSQSDEPIDRSLYIERLDYELSVINKMGFAGYFLIVMEFIQWAKDHDIPVGPGRGSGAGSLVAYSLLITNIDPLEFDLLFERFLNPERVSLPDFDIDFCIEGRDRVIQHVSELYGRDAVSQIITFGTMAAKAVVRDVARVQGKPYGLADRLSKMIPFEPGMTLNKAMQDEAVLADFVANNDEAEEIMEMAFRLEGLTRNVGKHAGGVVIAPTCLTDFTPVYCDVAGQNMMTQFDMLDVEQVGLVKFDFLGLRTLTIIDCAVNSINNARAIEGKQKVDIDEIPLEDALVYADLQEGKTTAVFQLESRGMKDMLKKVKPNRFADIVALVALYRPGPMQLADDFVKRKHGIEEVDYLHPRLESVLEDTYGVMLYQEQVMQIAQVLAGYSLAEADILRKAMGKKKPEEMATQREIFIAGALKNGVDKDHSAQIFNLMERFAGYGFNKPHSVGYALVAYQTAWLKHYFPSDFMASVLSADMQNTDKVVINIEEAHSMGLKINPPSINKGLFRFAANNNGEINYGLGAIKGLGEGPVDAIVGERQRGGTFTDLYEFCERVGVLKVNRRTVEALIGSGALDELVTLTENIDSCRALLFANQKDALKVAEQKARNVDSGVSDLFGEDMMIVSDEKGPYKNFDPMQGFSLNDRLTKEKETLGFYLTAHPLDVYGQELGFLAKSSIAELRKGSDEQVIVGLVVGVRVTKSRRGENLAFLTLDDKTGRIEVSIYSELYDKNFDLLKKDTVLMVKGNTTTDDFTDDLKMRATNVLSIEEARLRSAKKLKLNVDQSVLEVDFAQELAAILEPFKGANGQGCLVVVKYCRSEASVEVVFGEEWRVRPSDELMHDLRNRYGLRRVNLDY
ncbi:MAG: DNA polymerase III subunit alpha [Candidatus Azotimanducaceae bacterium]|uniref:DNA polymerase III subunit alpha n=1 Tax=OM182 bacterium TaxID=2510334 RepID=A0A520S0P1_9GAMM|nr:DNA polymerase III subunit alpha [Gammaproteobacteria bacterium]OUV68078.1 MAG: DNA polymerase III subunit alpha [Gammaproteobacteria bacterium TMED133]RZO76038.1 MAG: DNA polymerase III subunit alpha [OM182 bacterium]